MGNKIEPSPKLKGIIIIGYSNPAGERSWIHTCTHKMKSVSQRDICTAMVIAALFIIAKIENPAKYP